MVAIAAWASTAGAAPSPPPKRETAPAEMPTPTSTPAADDSAAIKAARAEAEDRYAKGYAIAQEGTDLLKAGKAGDAKKKFSKALKEFESAVARDPAYYQAWNMVGYCSRHTGDLKKAFAAYEKCLAIAPDYEEAHEYLGEAYLQSGDIDKAKIQLAWLRARDSDEADELAEAIEKAAPGSIPARPDSTAARDSTTAR
jgi:tetratricopeptide (TPR) repeat protein